MNIELNNNSEYDVEYVDDNEHNHNKKYKKFQIFVFLGCLVLAFLVWCYANYLDDPIVQKEVPLIIDLVAGDADEKIIQSSYRIVIYGEESVISGISEIHDTVNRNKFTDGNLTFNKKLDFPAGVYSHQKYVDLTLNNEALDD